MVPILPGWAHDLDLVSGWFHWFCVIFICYAITRKLIDWIDKKWKE